MSKSIKVSELSKAVSTYLEEYEEDITEGVKETTNSLTKQAIQDLKNESPRGVRGTYAEGWKKQTSNKKSRYTIKIHNSTDYQLTHLLEFGHAKRNGDMTQAIPHIRPVEEKYKKLYEQEITTVIRRRSKK